MLKTTVDEFNFVTYPMQRDILATIFSFWDGQQSLDFHA